MVTRYWPNLPWTHSRNSVLEIRKASVAPIVLAKEPDAPNPDVCGDARPVIDTLPTAFVEQVNRLAS